MEKKSWKKKVDKHVKTHFFKKSVGSALGVFLQYGTTQNKLYRGGYDQKQKKIENEFWDCGSVPPSLISVFTPNKKIKMSKKKNYKFSYKSPYLLQNTTKY